MKAATLGELDAEIAELEANLKELQAEDEALLSYWNHNFWSRISGRQEEAIKKLEANGSPTGIIISGRGSPADRKRR